MPENRFRAALSRGEFVVTAEMIPGRGAFEEPLEQSLATAREIYATGRVHAISITDNPGGNPAALADAIALELADEGICTLTHFTCKDRNRNQILSQLYSMERKGLENVLFMTGDYQASGWEGQARPCFDLDSVQIQMLAKQMNEGLVVQGRKGPQTEKPTHFFNGGVVNPFKYREGELIPQYLKLEKKVLGGAQFLISQVGYDVRKMQELLMYLHERHCDIPVIANVFVLTRGTAKLMKNGVIAGVDIPDELMETLEAEAASETKGRPERIERAAQQVAIAKGLGYAGVHIGGFGVDAAAIEKILDRAAEIGESWEAYVSQMSFGHADGCYMYAPAANGLNEDRFALVEEEIEDRKLFEAYRTSRFFYKWALTLDERFGKVLQWKMDRMEKKYGNADFPHRIEHASKAFIYGCKDCGDCGLESAMHSCPMAQCPKAQRNGPCGGSQDGWCEVHPGKRYCIWYMAYHRAKKYDEFSHIESFITPPNHWEYQNTSAWSNYTHRRDNAANRLPVDIGLNTKAL